MTTTTAVLLARAGTARAITVLAAAMLGAVGTQAKIVVSAPLAFNTATANANKILPAYAGSKIVIDANARQELKLAVAPSGAAGFANAKEGATIGSANVFLGSSVMLASTKGMGGASGTVSYGFKESIGSGTAAGDRYGWISVRYEKVGEGNGVHYKGTYTTAYNDVFGEPIRAGQIVADPVKPPIAVLETVKLAPIAVVDPSQAAAAAAAIREQLPAQTVPLAVPEPSTAAPAATAVPEPSALALVAAGLVGVLATRRRKAATAA